MKHFAARELQIAAEYRTNLRSAKKCWLRNDVGAIKLSDKCGECAKTKQANFTCIYFIVL